MRQLKRFQKINLGHSLWQGGLEPRPTSSVVLSQRYPLRPCGDTRNCISCAMRCNPKHTWAGMTTQNGSPKQTQEQWQCWPDASAHRCLTLSHRHRGGRRGRTTASLPHYGWCGALWHWWASPTKAKRFPVFRCHPDGQQSLPLPTCDVSFRHCFESAAFKILKTPQGRETPYGQNSKIPKFSNSLKNLLKNHSGKFFHGRTKRKLAKTSRSGSREEMNSGIAGTLEVLFFWLFPPRFWTLFDARTTLELPFEKRTKA